MSESHNERVRDAVRASYGKVAQTGIGSSDTSPDSDSDSGMPCCAPDMNSVRAAARVLGYSEAELDAVPEESNLGLGCGNPTAMAALEPGETVLDLGSGAGFDCFLAARQVGPTGYVIGVDMTSEMLAKARHNAKQGGFDNVEFRLGEIEHLPLADDSVDVVISNCVINLSPDKAAVFSETFRALKPGGRISVSDIVATTPIPPAMTNDMAMISGCVGGAALVDDVVGWMEQAGFSDIKVDVKEQSRAVIAEWLPGKGVEKYVASATIEATKP